MYGDDSGGGIPFIFYIPGDMFWLMGPFPNPKGRKLDMGWALPRAIRALSPVENQTWTSFENLRLNESEVGDGSRLKGSPEAD